MRLLLVTPERQLLDTDIEEVYAPGVLGQFGVLPEHVNFLTALGTGELRYRTKGADHYVAVSGGILEVLDDLVTVLADSAEFAEEISVTRATGLLATAPGVMLTDVPNPREAAGTDPSYVGRHRRDTE